VKNSILCLAIALTIFVTGCTSQHKTDVAATASVAKDTELGKTLEEWNKLQNSRGASWEGKIRGFEEAPEACTDRKKWEVGYRLYQQLTFSTAGVSVNVNQSDIRKELVETAKNYLADMGSLAEKPKLCEGKVFTDADVEYVIHGLKTIDATPEMAGTNPEQLRNLHFAYAKREFPELVKRYREGSADAAGALSYYLGTWNYTAKEIGLTQAEADKIMEPR
jgi:hypothetical protein